MQRAAPLPRADLAVGLPCLLQGEFLGEGDHALEQRVVAAQTVEVEPGELHR